LALALIIYGGWGLATFFHDRLPPLALGALGGWLIAWHGSLQHEVIHGHPTASRRFNTLLATPPLALWLPFEAYRQSHLAHHATENLTDPEHDPESRYPRQDAGFRGAVSRRSAAIQSTLLGRIAVGPLFEILGFLGREAVRLARGDLVRLRLWAVHAMAVAAVLMWLHVVCAMSLTQYLVCFVYPG
jgi:fatty acid desaturase